jgi:2-polyprenyl-3-methyl-5-hydroxy-6-metoxy-1,4-benzoquinol methylase
MGLEPTCCAAAPGSRRARRSTWRRSGSCIWLGKYGKVSTGWTVIDIGANIGVFSLYAARAGATVIAYDPLPEITAG